MSGTRSLWLLLMSFAFCVGLALAASTAGISAPATRTQPKLNPPTALWNAYPLRAPMRTRTGPAVTRPTVVSGNRIARRPSSGTGGFPTVFVMTGLLGALLASAVLFLTHAAPARAGGYRPNRGPLKTKPPFRTGRTGTPSPARGKPSLAKRPPSGEQPGRTRPSPPPPNPVGEISAASSPPDERETTDDLLDAPRPSIKRAEDPDPQLLYAVRQAPPQRPGVAADQFCEIKFWRGYVKCQLYVEVEGSPGASVESSFFRLRNPLLPDDRAQSVLADLIADLERSGWLVVETGPVWYRHRLRRFTQTP